MKNIPQNTIIDGYKLGHIDQYIEDTGMVYANMTPRSDRLARVLKDRNDGTMVFFGALKALKEMKERWDDTFFSKDKEEVITKYARRIKNYVGSDYGDNQIEAMSKLHDLGYLPLEVKTLPEGSFVNMQVPTITIKNTHKDFYWLTNYCETYLSCSVWHMCNAASLSREYYKTSKHYADITGADEIWLGVANHCFAARGHRGMQDAMDSGMGHLLFSVGSDTLWAIDGFEEYYNADSDKELIACSVNAFEHATATQRIAYYRQQGFDEHPLQAEEESLKEICNTLYPKGIVSYVADSEDYFGVLSKVLPKIKDLILNRQEDSMGLCKFVLRPDSSPKTPLEVILGYNLLDIQKEDYKGTDNMILEDGYDGVISDGVPYLFDEKGERVEVDKSEAKGSLQLLWEIFGGTDEKGYKVINPKVGLIYGEAIDLELQDKIYSEMIKKGWCVSNVLFGTGSWGFLDRSSRDSYSQALKGTHSMVGDEEISMQKNPKTAVGSKKSAKGLLKVEFEDGKFVMYDEQTREQEQQGLLETVFLDGELVKETSLAEIRQRVQDQL